MHEQHTDTQQLLNYNYITDGIYIGNNMCCQTHFKKELLKTGVNADISLEEERLDTPFGVDSFLWLPTKDHTPPTPKQIELGVVHIEQLVMLEQKVYVHCKNGHGRAPTLVAAYVIKTKHMKPDEAVTFIKARRPVIHLEDSQQQALEEFFKHLIS